MLLNVCRHTYMLKANQINVNQLFAVVNGCLTNEIIDRFTWDYLMDEESKKLQTHKKIQDVMKKYIHDYDDVEIKTDEIDESGSPVIITSQKNIYEGNLTQQDIEDAFKEENYLNDTEVNNLELDEIDKAASPVIERQDDGRYRIRYDLAYDSLSPLWPNDSLYKGNLPDEVLLKGLNEDSEGCLSSSQIEDAIESGEININLNNFNMSDFGIKQEFGLSKEDIEKIIYNQDVMKILKDIIDLVNNK